MRRLIIFILLVFGLVLYSKNPCTRVFAEDLSEDNLQFNIDGGKIYFFQPQTGKIFVYQITTNRFSYQLTLEELGKDLKKSRSFSTIEKEKEY